jgi:hypothetical protein
LKKEITALQVFTPEASFAKKLFILFVEQQKQLEELCKE